VAPTVILETEGPRCCNSLWGDGTVRPLMDNRIFGRRAMAVFPNHGALDRGRLANSLRTQGLRHFIH
jgi:hypothetical protein